MQLDELIGYFLSSKQYYLAVKILFYSINQTNNIEHIKLFKKIAYKSIWTAYSQNLYSYIKNIASKLIELFDNKEDALKIAKLYNILSIIDRELGNSYIDNNIRAHELFKNEYDNSADIKN